MSKNTWRRFTEEERLRAVQQVCVKGLRAADVAEVLGCTTRTVELWVQKSRGGRKPTALRTPVAPGAPSKLTPAQQKQLLKRLKAGPQAAGFAGQLWTGPRIAKLIEQEFGVTYHSRYISQLLKGLGWSVQKPKRQALERDEERVQEWVATDWPRIKKKRDS